VDCGLGGTALLNDLWGRAVGRREQDVEIVEPTDRGDVLAQYYVDATKGVDRDPVYCAELGLAIEQLKEGLTIEQLWSVL
jgi:Bardet-Biedl syndrome 5 protein